MTDVEIDTLKEELEKIIEKIVKTEKQTGENFESSILDILQNEREKK